MGQRTNDKILVAIRVRIRIAALVGRALAEVCTVPVLLVIIMLPLYGE